MIYSADEAEQLTAEDLLIAWGTQSVIASRIAEEGYVVPQSLDSSIKNCKRELDHKLEADLERELQTLESRRAALATVQEKRDALDARAEARSQGQGCYRIDEVHQNQKVADQR
jgi:hypothetical protein